MKTTHKTSLRVKLADMIDSLMCQFRVTPGDRMDVLFQHVHHPVPTYSARWRGCKPAQKANILSSMQQCGLSAPRRSHYNE